MSHTYRSQILGQAGDAFWRYCVSVSAGMLVILTGPKSAGELVTLFDT